MKNLTCRADESGKINMSPISKVGGGKNCYMCCWSRYVICVNFCHVMNAAGSYLCIFLDFSVNCLGKMA